MPMTWLATQEQAHTLAEPNPPTYLGLIPTALEDELQIWDSTFAPVEKQDTTRVKIAQRSC